MPNSNMSPIGNTPDVSTQHSRPERAGQSAARRLSRLLLAAFAGLAGGGCQCCCCGTNAWSCAVDCVVDHAVPFDCLYCSKLDLTRINRPGGVQCRSCCRPVPCCSNGVYAHRWMSSRPQNGDAGLQAPPDFPSAAPGPYFPPTDQAVPLFESPPGEAPPSQEAPMTPEDSAPQPMPPDAPPTLDGGVTPAGYQRPAAESLPGFAPHGSPIVPVDVIFAN